MGEAPKPPLLKPRAFKPPTTRKFTAAEHPADFENFSAVYWKAAKDLSGEHDDGSVWAFPILFLYRHAIETALKAVLIGHGIPIDCVLERGHDLMKQMPNLKTLAEREGAALTSTFETIITKWNLADPDGFRLRYPTDKSGKPLVLQNGKAFHLKPLVEDAEHVLEQLHDMLSELQSREYTEFLRTEGIIT